MSVVVSLGEVLGRYPREVHLALGLLVLAAAGMVYWISHRRSQLLSTLGLIGVSVSVLYLLIAVVIAPQTWPAIRDGQVQSPHPLSEVVGFFAGLAVIVGVPVALLARLIGKQR
ncbi:hypothetical protein ACQKE8_21605 [Sphingobium limneticum]|jgi:hypothetical protein|uniref:hypothetical protein n=1 Tax=Sphingobium limneticum TaxID=1007511 RepID=UPI003D05A717